jgi:hypothetical protein
VSETPQHEVRFCTACGSPAAGMTFCSSCGHRLRALPARDDAAALTTQPSQPAPAPYPAANPPSVAPQADPGPSVPTPAVVSTSFTWPVPEQRVDLMGNSVPLEVAVVGVMHLVAALWLTWSSRSLLTVVRYASDLPASAVLSVVAMLGTWALVVFGLAKTGQLLIKTRPLGRPLAITWAVLAFAVATADGTPNSLYLVALALGLGAAALYLAPSTKAAFAEAELTATPPTPIAFSLTMIAVLFGVSAAYGVALLPLLGQVGEMNSIGEFIGEGAIGTKFVFGLLTLGAACALGFTAFKKIGNGNVGGRQLITGLAALSMLSLWLTLSAADSMGTLGGSNLAMINVAGLVIWGSILLPLWLGAVPAGWFDTKPVGGFGKPAPQSPTTGDMS